MFGSSEDPLHELVVTHGRLALASANLFVLVVDGREGLVAGDQEIAAVIRAKGVPVVVAINKLDDKRARAGAMDFYELGFDPVIEISAEHGTGVDDLLDEVVKRLPARKAPGTGHAKTGAAADPDVDSEDEDEGADRDESGPARGSRDAERAEVGVAIIGRPNVGKSSLVNRLLKEERVLVSDMPGTTRDAIDSTLTWHRRRFRIVDTAGIRRPGRVARGGQVEAISVLTARRAIEAADVAVLVIDATEGVSDQEAAIAGEADRAGRGIILLANKWDLMKDQGPDAAKTFDEDVRYRLKFLDYAPILHVSARTGERAPKLLEAIDRVAESRRRRVPTPELNRFVEAVTAVHPPSSPDRRHVRILYAAQIGIEPPTFVFFTNVATKFHFSYQRFLENRLRESFGFFGTPLRLQVRRRGGKEAAAAGTRRVRAGRSRA